MKKYSLKAKCKQRLLLWTAAPMFTFGAALAGIGFAFDNATAIVIGACLIFGACIEFIYFFNYEYDFCIDYENREIHASILGEKGKSDGKIFFSCVMSAEIIEKEALAAEFGFEKIPSHALVLRGAENPCVVPLDWFSEEQCKKILDETKKIAGAYL